MIPVHKVEACHLNTILIGAVATLPNGRRR